MLRFLSSFWSRVNDSQGLKQSALTIGGNFMSTGLSAVAMILISRLLGPFAYGQFSVGFAVVQILTRINEVGLNAAVIKFAGSISDQAQIKNVVAYTLKLKLVASLVLMVLGLLLVMPISNWLSFEYPILIAGAVVFSLATTAYEHLASTLQALHRFTQAVLINTIQAASKLIGIGLLWLLNSTSVFPIFAWYMLSPFMAVACAKWLLPKWFTLSISQVQNSQQPSGLLKMARFSAIGFIAAGLIENLDILFVQSYLNSYEAGLLSGVTRIAMMLTLVAYSLGNVLYPRVARYKSKEHLLPYLRKAILVLGVSGIGFLAFIPFAKLVILLSIGEAYVGGTSILIILVAAAFLTVATIPFLALFYTFKADWYFLVSGLLQLAIVVVGNMLFVPEYGLVASAWTKLATKACLFIVTVGIAMWLYFRDYHNQKRI